LAPRIADALTGEGESEVFSVLEPEDRAVMAIARQSVGRWLGAVDRVTPAELLDDILHESAYAYELQGPRQPQARENLKKLRLLVRRIQNRGYATLSRIADHLEQLAVGDESNAAIDAVDAVNLMTVHASKGLEFPIVFVANLGRGTGSAREPIRVGYSLEGEASVSIADYQSEADEDAREREREETKRLLYVALTRARDRLYLCAIVRGGECRMNRGSLGEVLPRSFPGIFVTALTEAAVVWEPAGGAAHVFAVGSGKP
jgi:ATP-dependent exoDNAse (exonuclease V) beta subunit